jgi:MOSC domain-containing protein YiiM
LSINVALPREITWRGKTVYTSVWKEPVQGRRLVRRLNIDGDAQGDLAGHGGEHRARRMSACRASSFASMIGAPEAINPVM